MVPPSPVLRAGSSAPLGSTLSSGGVNFSVFARHTEAVELCLFASPEDADPSAVLCLAGEQHHTDAYWHGLVEGLQAGQIYGFRLPGEPDGLLLDPYAVALAVPAGYCRERGQRRDGGGWSQAIKCVVADLHRYDWEGDRPLRRPLRETVIYELHLRGFTAAPGAGVAPELAGTYGGLIEKIPYLQALGITAVELLPVFAFDPQAAPAGMANYWGYQPISVFAPHLGYASGHDPLAALDQFRDLVKALHRAGIEVILDVVFNHTAEGGGAPADAGPTFSYRGLAAHDYYLLQSAGGSAAGGDDSRDIDDTGCGNTFNANNPVVRRLIRHSLRHWVEHMHVDGFRFDLAAVLSRDETGTPEPRPPVLLDLDSDPVLAGIKLIAEAWDAAGLYEVGSFVGERWLEWNGRFRDDLRRFLKGDSGLAWAAGQRLIGSPDIYGPRQREAEVSVNFITCHDGFTLADLVSYNTKHNAANGEDNRDGSNDNASWNCGVEGETDDGVVLALRQRQMRNFLCLLLLSVGTPMLAMGDEVARSQRGNNNTYGQDNPTSWFDWALVQSHADLLRFTRELIACRQRRDVVIDHDQLPLAELLRRCSITWHGVEPFQPDWSHDSHSLAFTCSSAEHSFRLHLMVNAWWQGLEFRLPPTDLEGEGWHRWIDTALPSPGDIVAWAGAPPLTGSRYGVQPRSVVALVAGHPRG
ncbi:MAG: isoamylase [Cyanobacteria bacterium J06638_7]